MNHILQLWTHRQEWEAIVEIPDLLRKHFSFLWHSSKMNVSGNVFNAFFFFFKEQNVHLNVVIYFLQHWITRNNFLKNQSSI